MKASLIFTALSLFTRIQFPLSVFPFMVNSLVDFFVATKRITNFLSYDEVDGMNIHPALSPKNGDNAPTASIKVEGNATFSWKHNVRIQKKGAPVTEEPETEKKFSLKNINLHLQSGHLTMICGRRGEWEIIFSTSYSRRNEVRFWQCKDQWQYSLRTAISVDIE